MINWITTHSRIINIFLVLSFQTVSVFFLILSLLFLSPKWILVWSLSLVFEFRFYLLIFVLLCRCSHIATHLYICTFFFTFVVDVLFRVCQPKVDYVDRKNKIITITNFSFLQKRTCNASIFISMLQNNMDLKITTSLTLAHKKKSQFQQLEAMASI